MRRIIKIRPAYRDRRLAPPPHAPPRSLSAFPIATFAATFSCRFTAAPEPLKLGAPSRRPASSAPPGNSGRARSPSRPKNSGRRVSLSTNPPLPTPYSAAWLRGRRLLFRIHGQGRQQYFRHRAIARRRGRHAGADFLAAAANPALIRDLAPQAPSLEGYLFPSTYRISHSTTAAELCRQMTGPVSQTMASLVGKKTARPGNLPTYTRPSRSHRWWKKKPASPPSGPWSRAYSPIASTAA